MDGNNSLTRSFAWGLNELLNINAGGSTYFAGMDGNQNVVALINGASGNAAAVYDYDPFGQTVVSTGENAAQNPFKFSSQYTDNESGFLNYGYRYYNPSLGRWINRDPIAESGGPNLYGFVYNNAINSIDLLGAKTLSEYAEEKLWDLYLNHSHEVGSEYQGPRNNRQLTNCTIYVTNVLEYAYEKIGRSDVASTISGMKQSSGVDIAVYLQSLDWKAYYWNPDVREPRNNASPRRPDGSLRYGAKEHAQSYKDAVRNGTYGQGRIRVHGFIVNYALTSHRTRRIRPVVPVIIPSSPPVMVPVPMPYTEDYTPQNNMGAFNRFSQVRFAFLTTLSGWHNFLYSYGMVYEVHWDQQAPSLYERSSFYNWNGYNNGDLSGVALIPPDITFEGDKR